MSTALPHYAGASLLQSGQVTNIPSPYFAVPEGLLSYYSFDVDTISGSTLWDLATGGYNATSTASPTLSTTGIYGSTLLFNGSSQYVSSSTSQVLNLTPASNFSISLWLNTTNVTATQAPFCIGNTGNSTPVILIEVGATSGAVTFLVRDSSSTAATATTAALLSNSTWYHVVCTKQGSTVSIYVNGVFRTSATGSPTASALNSVSIGAALRTSAALFFGGSIRDTRVYNRALDNTDVQTLYQAGLFVQRHSNLSLPEDAELPVLTTISSNTYTLSLGSGSYAYTGSSSLLNASRNLSLNSGSYSYLGTSATLHIPNASIIPQSGSYVYTGTGVGLSSTTAVIVGGKTRYEEGIKQLYRHIAAVNLGRKGGLAYAASRSR